MNHGLMRGDIAGGERGQPQVEVAVQRFFGEGGDLRRQAQGFGIAPGEGGLLVAAGHALQPAAAGAVRFGGGGGDIEAGIATEGAEQDAGGLFDLGQLDGGLRVIAGGGLGDPVVPELADEFFHDFLNLPGAGVFVNPGERGKTGFVRFWRPRC